MLNLSERMLMAAKMVRTGNTVADIGTDHAYLPAYLVLNGIIPKALACDVRKGPLENAKKTVEHYGIEDKITLRLSDGFDEIEPFEADDFIMCGMGGTLMEQLVQRTHWLKDKAKRIIVQPQSHAEDIRRFFVENGFEILFEDACTDSGKINCAMVAEYTGKITKKSISYIYTGELPKCKKAESRLYLENIYSRLCKKLDAERIHGSAETVAHLEKVTFEMREILNDMQTDS